MLRSGTVGKSNFWLQGLHRWIGPPRNQAARWPPTCQQPTSYPHLCMAGGPGLEPVWRSGPGDPDYAVSARKRIVYTASGPNSVVRGREAAPGLPILGPKPCRLYVSGPKPRSPDLLVPISTPASDLAPRPFTNPHLCGGRPRARTGKGRWGQWKSDRNHTQAAPVFAYLRLE